MCLCSGGAPPTGQAMIQPSCPKSAPRYNPRHQSAEPMPMIREIILSTTGPAGAVHLAPLGIIADGEEWIIAPFRPSTTLENLREVPFAVANYSDDVRVFAGCLTGRRDWPVSGSAHVPVPRLAAALAHAELAVVEVTDDAQRPRFRCRVVHRASHAPFEG